jgi:hypothetical protein
MVYFLLVSNNNMADASIRTEGDTSEKILSVLLWYVQWILEKYATFSDVMQM